MLARETRTPSFAENSNNVMSELFQAIQKVRGTRTVNNAEPEASIEVPSSVHGPGYLKDTHLTNGETKSFAVSGKEIQANAISGREIPTGLLRSISVHRGESEHLTNGFTETSGSPMHNSLQISKQEVQPIQLAGGSVVSQSTAPPIPPPLPPDSKVLTVKPTSAAFKNVKLNPVSPNRPQKFVQQDNTANIFAELTSILQKRFKKPEDEIEAEKNASSTLSGNGRNTDSLKRSAEKKAEHYSHIKEVSEKLVNGLNIVIVEQNEKEPVNSGSVNSLHVHVPVADIGNSTHENTQPEQVGNVNKGNNEKTLSNGSPVSNSTKVLIETGESSAVNVSSLIKTYQSSEVQSGNKASKAWTNNERNSPGSLADFMKKSISEKKSLNGLSSVGENEENNDLNGSNINDSEKILPSRTVGGNLSKTQEMETKFKFEATGDLANGKKEISSSDEDVVKAIVVHGSLGKSHDPLKGRGKPRSTMTETAIASIILDKAIDSDIDSDVFFEKSNHERSHAVTDEEINRYKKENFGISPIKVGGADNNKEEEIKVIKDVLTSSLRSKELVRPSLSIFDSSLDIDSPPKVEIPERAEAVSNSNVDFKTEVDTDATSQYDEDTAVLDIADEVDFHYESKTPKINNVGDISKVDVNSGDTDIDMNGAKTNRVDNNANVHNESDSQVNRSDLKLTGTKDVVNDDNSSANLSKDDSLSSSISPKITPQNVKEDFAYRQRFSSFSSYTSSMDGTHNSSEEFVVVADVHVSSDDDKVLESSIDGSSPVSHDIASKIGSKSIDLYNESTSNNETILENSETARVTASQTTNHKTNHVEQLINDSVVINSDKLSQSMQSTSTESLHSNNNDKHSNDFDTTSDVIINKSVAMVNNHSESPTSSLGDYEMPYMPADNFNNISEIPIKSSSPAIHEHDSSENEEQNTKTSFQDMKMRMASGIDFSEEELDNSSSSDSERQSSNQNAKSSLHSSVLSLTDTEVQNLTRRSSANPTPTLQNFTSLRSTIRTEDGFIDNNSNHFQPAVKEETYFASHPSQEEGQIKNQSAINSENSPTINNRNTNGASQFSGAFSSVTTHKSPVSTGEKNQAVSVIHLKGKQENKQSDETSLNDVTGIKETSLNPRSPSIIVNSDTDSDHTYSFVEAKSHQDLSKSVIDYTNNNSPIAIMHYGPPPPSIDIVKNNRVVRHVPVHHVHPGHQIQRNNTVAYMQNGGPRRVFRFETLAKDHPNQRIRQSRSPNKEKATTMFHDFSRTANYPRSSSGQTNFGYFSSNNKNNKQYVYSNFESPGAYTVMHIAPQNRHGNVSSRPSKQTRPLVAGYGPDLIPVNPHDNYSSHDTLASLPFTPDSQNTVFTQNKKFVQRKPSFTVMTSSSSSFSDSIGQEKIYIDLRKPKSRHLEKRSRSQENYNRNNNAEESKASFSDEHNSSLDKTASTAISSSFTSDTSHERSVRLLSFSRSSEADLDLGKRTYENKQEFSLPDGVNVKIFTSGETKVIIGSEENSSEGSPFLIDVDEGRMPTANGDGLFRGEEDRPATFYVDARGLRGELGVQVEGPNSIAKCNIEPERDGVYAVTYVPVEVGKYRAVVKWNGKEIPGSPFHPKVVDPRKVKVVGGWQHYMDTNNRVQLLVDEEKRIPFDVTDAGPGLMTAEVRGPGGKIPCRIEESHHKRTVCFTPREEGDHHIYAYWSDHTLVNAPFHGFALGRRRSPDPTKVVLSGRGLKEAVVHKEAEFQIDGSEAGPGRPEVRLEGVKRNVPVRVSSLGNGRYRCTYIPESSGAYLLHINWNDRQLRGSPFKVHVINAHYPQKVVVTGEGLKGGVMGRDINVIIDTRKAGPGELTAHCMGPHKVAYCELEDMRDGTYKLNIRPQEPGRHILQIKYGGEHVLGSPYVLRVGAQPDASKVRVYGPGVENGVLATFQSRFIVETKGAGAGQLTVRIRGPKGAFQVEMLRDSQKDRTIMCRFDPSETGLYQVFVKWSGVDVPGSPFHVYIVDTENDLRHIHQGHIPPQFQPSTLNRSIYNSEYSSWKEDDGYRM